MGHTEAVPPWHPLCSACAVRSANKDVRLWPRERGERRSVQWYHASSSRMWWHQASSRSVWCSLNRLRQLAQRRLPPGVVDPLPGVRWPPY